MTLDDYPELAKLSTMEKISLVESIWDSIRSNESDVPVPESHKQELDRRAANMKTEDLLSLDELKRRVENRVKNRVEK